MSRNVVLYTYTLIGMWWVRCLVHCLISYSRFALFTYEPFLIVDLE